MTSRNSLIYFWNTLYPRVYWCVRAQTRASLERLREFAGRGKVNQLAALPNFWRQPYRDVAYLLRAGNHAPLGTINWAERRFLANRFIPGQRTRLHCPGLLIPCKSFEVPVEGSLGFERARGRWWRGAIRWKMDVPLRGEEVSGKVDRWCVSGTHDSICVEWGSWW